MRKKEIVLNLPPKRIQPKYLLYSIVNVSLFFAIASVAVPSALGYRINWDAKKVQQTGLIELSGVQQNYDLTIYVNNQLQQENRFPYKLAWIFPGSYTVRVEREGYQTWEKQVSVLENHRYVYRSIVLMYTEPKVTTMPKTSPDDFLIHGNDMSNIQIKEGNELWVNDKLFVRMSNDIQSARWYPDKEHVAFQAGDTIYLLDLSSKTTQTIIKFGSSHAASYAFYDGGRIVVTQVENDTKAYELFEPVSLLDRITAATGR